MPFLVVLAPTETHLALIYGYFCIEDTYFKLYKSKIHIFGQNTDSHTSAHKCAAQLNLTYSSLCYAHIKRSPADKKQRHMIKGSQEAKDKFLDEVAGPDVEKLHLCQTTKQATRACTVGTCYHRL